MLAIARSSRSVSEDDLSVFVLGVDVDVGSAETTMVLGGEVGTCGDDGVGTVRGVAGSMKGDTVAVDVDGELDVDGGEGTADTRADR